MVFADEVFVVDGVGEGSYVRVRAVVVDEFGAFGEAFFVFGVGEGSFVRV